MELPEISEKTDLTLEQAKAEFRQLVKLLEVDKETGKLKNGPQYGWAPWLENKIEARLNFLRTTITDYVIGDSKNGK